MHQAVLVAEVVELLGVRPEGAYIDCTVGRGGHAAAIARRMGEGGRLLGLDRDAGALARAAERLGALGSRCVLVHADFAGVEAVAREKGFGAVDGVVADLGLSSEQLEEAERGFSFQRDGPLDMRMDTSTGETAAALLKRVGERELALLLRDLGEERQARRVAAAIVREEGERPIETTARLAEIVERAKGGRRGRLHPATKTFMALRMAVNHELESLAAGLEGGLRLLKPGGRLGVITFHSIEDRLVKRCFARHAGRRVALPAGGEQWEGEAPAVRKVTRKPVTASDEEREANPRARSAKLRVVERMG